MHRSECVTETKFTPLQHEIEVLYTVASVTLHVKSTTIALLAFPTHQDLPRSIQFVSLPPNSGLPNHNDAPRHDLLRHLRHPGLLPRPLRHLFPHQRHHQWSSFPHRPLLSPLRPPNPRSTHRLHHRHTSSPHTQEVGPDVRHRPAAPHPIRANGHGILHSQGLRHRLLRSHNRH